MAIVYNFADASKLEIWSYKYSGTCVLWTPWDQQKCPDYQGVLIFQFSLYDKASFGTITKCVDYAAGAAE